jgi:hypothetical protein
MSSNPSIINISSDSSDSSESLTSPLTLSTIPRGLTKEQTKKRKHDANPPSPSPSEDPANVPYDLDDSDAARELERRWNALERGEASRAPNPAVSSESSEDPNPWIPYQPPLRELVSPFIYTSSDEDEDENDALYIPPSTPERPQSPCPRRPSRPRKSNPPLPKTREVVIGLPCPQQQELFTRNKGNEKMDDVKGKGKGPMMCESLSISRNMTCKPITQTEHTRQT